MSELVSFPILSNEAQPAKTGAILGQPDTDRLASAIDALAENDRLILWLYYYENLTLEEIGTVLGLNQPAVASLHTAALAQLCASGSLSQCSARSDLLHT